MLFPCRDCGVIYETVSMSPHTCEPQSYPCAFCEREGFFTAVNDSGGSWVCVIHAWERMADGEGIYLDQSCIDDQLKELVAAVILDVPRRLN